MASGLQLSVQGPEGQVCGLHDATLYTAKGPGNPKRKALNPVSLVDEGLPRITSLVR